MIRRGATGVLAVALALGSFAPAPATAARPTPAPATHASSVATALPPSTVLALQRALGLLGHPVPTSGFVDLETRAAVALLVDKYRWPAPPPGSGGVDTVLARRIVALADGVRSTPSACLGAQVLCVDQERMLLLVVEGDRVVDRLDVRLGDSPAVNRVGRFAVVRKADRTVSSEYGALMLDALFFDHGRAIHYSEQFARTGYAGTSHGCVNLRDAGAAHRLFLATPVGTPVVVLPDTHLATTAREVRAAMLDAGLPGDARISVSVRDLATGARSGVGDLTPVRPASNAKLLTAAAALAVLGPQRRLATRVVLTRDHRLVVVGAGDPGLGRADVSALAARAAAALRARGITHVRVAAGLGAFRGVRRPEGWPAGAMGEQVGRLSALRLSGDHAGTGWRAVLTLVRRELHRAGVVSRAVAPTGAVAGRVLAAHRGAPVRTLVRDMLRESLSDHAEALRALVVRTRGLDPDAVEGEVSRLGVDVTGVSLADGSGLSGRDRVTTRALVSLLAVLSASSSAALREIAADLPVAGRSGTLGPGSGRFLSTATRCAVGRVQAKTGTLSGLSALSGYADDLGRHRVAFSIVVSHPTAGHRQRVDAVDAGVVALVQCG